MALSDVLDLLRCPHCGDALSPTADRRGVHCQQGHSFDLARQGYLNLLRSGPVKNADTTAMIQARDRFLAGGHYQPIADALRDELESGSAPVTTVLDAGAGTGYYLASVLDGLPGARGLALDVSVAACRRAARVHRRLGAVVADTWQPLPVRTGGIDAVLTVFAPRNLAEFRRVLGPAGRLLIVTPLPEHLSEVRGPLQLLEIEPGKRERLETGSAGLFSEGVHRELRYPIRPTRSELTDLVAMGPNAFHLSTEQIAARVAALDPAPTVTVAVSVTVLRPRQPASPTATRSANWVR
ncbi:methyltransferase domain-containing protein [Microlunatus panaciterrae]|uniref:23S rRNA (Guanine745-N1)-methyltransferase n=1 Tax=Microlunatus panaciterrae TaxID=400768 RepID=A0ABS2RQR8_9ACTN|nr:methyltransferase domain-containing protein [Microlunatus panaciterrae]MBM7800269.1 23S rRNA (guanine745-N1)-methyltransferase [Microlunatus panaciterrae]